MRRAEAIDLLREISMRCGSELIVDMVSLIPYKEPVMPFRENPESRFRIYLQTSLSNRCESKIMSVLQEKGLEMNNTGHFIIIYQPLK